jgi:carbon storage regulator CsrA
VQYFWLSINESLKIGDGITVTLIDVRHTHEGRPVQTKVRIGVQAPRSVPVFRGEIQAEIVAEKNLDD